MAETILITGTSTGIGYGTAKAFTNAGYRVIATVRNTEDAERIKRELGENIFPVLCDVTYPEQVASLPQYVKEISENGWLDGLINNAGIEIVDPAELQNMDDIRSQFETNVFGLISVTKTLLPLLGTKENGQSHAGRIINISSVGGVIALPFLSAYASTKFAVEGYSHSLRRELRLFGIKVVIIGVGAVKSEIWRKDKLDSKSYKGTVYETPFEKLKSMMKSAESGAISEKSIGEKILKTYKARSPKPRYTFTPNKFFNWSLPSVLPHSWVDALFNGMLAIRKQEK
ncbi:MAG: SDR family oxidoreductase [Chitinophagaceae bacterium]|nr:SDR family oxidoreductase [Chitinophagaceae bacterium]